jgi:hypothetical protein
MAAMTDISAGADPVVLYAAGSLRRAMTEIAAALRQRRISQSRLDLADLERCAPRSQRVRPPTFLRQPIWSIRRRLRLPREAAPS